MGFFSLNLRSKKKRALELPSQTALRQACLRPGRQVELLLVTDTWGNESDVRLSRLHDLDQEGRLLLAQTFPPLGRHYVGQWLEITFLIRVDDMPGGRRLRVGYKSPLKAVWSDYLVRPGLRGDVLVVDGPEVLSKFTLRRHYRLPAELAKELEVFLMPWRVQVRLLDISVGGARFSHPRARHLSVGESVDLLLVCGSLGIPLEGRVVRNGSLGSREEAIPFTAVRFNRLAPAHERQLASLINDLQRGA